MNLDSGLLLNVGVLLFGMAAGWGAQKARTNSAHHMASEALKAVEAVRKGLNAHGERITRVETNVMNQADLMRDIKSSVQALTARIDAVLARE